MPHDQRVEFVQMGGQIGLREPTSELRLDGMAKGLVFQGNTELQSLGQAKAISIDDKKRQTQGIAED